MFDSAKPVKFTMSDMPPVVAISIDSGESARYADRYQQNAPGGTDVQDFVAGHEEHTRVVAIADPRSANERVVGLGRIKPMSLGARSYPRIEALHTSGKAIIGSMVLYQALRSAPHSFDQISINAAISLDTPTSRYLQELGFVTSIEDVYDRSERLSYVQRRTEVVDYVCRILNKNRRKS